MKVWTQQWYVLVAMASMSAGLAMPVAAAESTGATGASTTPALSAGQTWVAGKVAAPFATLAGSRDNALALTAALRTGTTASLTYTTTSSTGQAVQTTVAITPPTKAMGWGNVSHSLSLAQFALHQAGIDNPTSAQLQAALNGGSITTADGKTIALAGVLKQRADGMGWRRIAQSYGTSMGATTAAIKSPAKSASTSVATSTVTSSATNSKAAADITTSHGSKGLTTASGASAGASGIVTSAGGHGQANALGRGVVTAAGGSAAGSPAATAHGRALGGVVTGTGAAATPVSDAASSGGAGNASAHGKAKGGG